MVNDPNMPNPFLILMVFGLALLVVRAFTTTVHELGHAIAGMILYKGDFDVYIGTYGDTEKGIHFKVGRLNIHFKYAPFSFSQGVVMYRQEDNSVIKDFIVTLAGPLASLLASLICIYSALFCGFDDLINIDLYILAGSAFSDFWYNIKLDPEPITLYDGRIAYNDGYRLKHAWNSIRNKP